MTLSKFVNKAMDSSNYIQIIDNIHTELTASELSDNIGLHAGTSGIALFIVYYDRIVRRKNKISQKVVDILEHNIKCIDSGNWQHTICGGISGFGWLCEHLRKLEILNSEDIKFLNDLDSYLYKQMITDIGQGNYDYLHGALGVGTYFLSRFDKKEVFGYVNDLLAELEKSAVPCKNNALKWISVLNPETGKKGYNISLSHGMASIVAFLTKLYQANFETKRVKNLLVGTINYILDQITYTENSISYFPSYSKESSNGNHYSRLGWCYGDLGIAYTLWKAATAMKNKEWIDIAIKILRHNSNRSDLQKNLVMDAGMCHGSVGIAHIFWNLYRNTFIKEFLDASDYWFNITLKMAKYTDGLAGFKSWHAEEYGGSVKSTSLLEGISGIGLAFMSHLNSRETGWEQCFMLT